MSAHGNYIYSQGKVMIMAKSSWFYCIYLLYERQTLVSDVKADWPIHHPDLLTLHPWSHYPGKNSVVRIPPHLECMLVFIFHSVRASIMWAWHYFLPQRINHTHLPVLALENIIGRMSFGAESSSMNVSDRYRQVGGISTENLMKWRLRRPDTAQVSRQLRGIRWQVLESMLKTFSGQVRDGRVIVSRIYIVCTRRQTKMVQLPPWQ